ncbi:MAG TPA: hypothetical protein VKF32_10645, partial [Thermoanaerobaculia bacterium]|nr:hypothetical protein [Thermoanaerobaculia bacterium]
FRGTAAIVTADGRPILHAVLHGVAGLGGDAAGDCAAPGHLEGSLDPVFTVVPGGPTLFREETSIVEARFVADLNTISASAVPLYRGRVDGFVVPAGAPPPGLVTVASDKRSYGPSDPITALVANGSSSTIVGYDGETYCTIVRLEKRVESGWSEVAGCPLARMPLPTKIPAGETLSVALPPDATTLPRWEPGSYRLAFTYVGPDVTPSPGTAARVTIVSPPFDVIAAPSEGGVTIVTSKDSYRANEAIVAALVNGTDQPWLLGDHRSFCTLLTLEHQDADGTWTPVSPCLVLTPTRLVTLEPHQRLTVALPPDPALPRFEPGVYRLSTDVMSPNAAGAPQPAPLHVESARFLVFGVRTDAPAPRDAR